MLLCGPSHWNDGRSDWMTIPLLYNYDTAISVPVSIVSLKSVLYENKCRQTTLQNLDAVL